jgi:hypothetical protein
MTAAMKMGRDAGGGYPGAPRFSDLQNRPMLSACILATGPLVVPP